MSTEDLGEYRYGIKTIGVGCSKVAYNCKKISGLIPLSSGLDKVLNGDMLFSNRQNPSYYLKDLINLYYLHQ